MYWVSLAGLNLNHLVALEVLLNEAHVGRAAAAMGVTQSAMSHTLRSLRELLDDPLLVRQGNRMVMTPFAEQARGRLQRGLSELEAVVSGRAAFDPTTITDTFTLGSQDGPAAGFAGPLWAALQRQAPKAQFRIQPIEPDAILEQLGHGGVDVAFVSPLVSLEGLSFTPLAGTAYAVACRQGHPHFVDKRMTLAAYCKVEHAVLSITGEGPSFVDHLLAKKGRERRVRVRVPYLMALAEVVATSDLVTALPEVVVDFLCELWPLEKKRFPLPLDPLPGFLAWHPRYDADPARTFFRELVAEVARASVSDGRPSFKHAATRRR
jgi:DNA-binding transcriptional LysR family regulator